MDHTTHRDHTALHQITLDHTGSHQITLDNRAHLGMQKTVMEPEDNRALPVTESGKHTQGLGTPSDPLSKARKRTHPCEFCGKIFHSQSVYKRHKVIHTGEKPYRCEYCGKSFNRTSHLSEHMLTHDRVYFLKRFACDYCGKAFGGNTNLQNHIRTHTGEKPYSCEYCGKAFAQKGNLTAHRLTHGGEKTYSCTLCSKSYAQATSLNRHIELVHCHKKGKKGIIKRKSTPRPQNSGNVREELFEEPDQSQERSSKGVTAKIGGATEDADGAIVNTEYVIVKTEAATANTEDYINIPGSAIGNIEGALNTGYTEDAKASIAGSIASTDGGEAHTQYFMSEVGDVIANTHDAIDSTDGAIPYSAGAIVNTEGVLANPSVASSMSRSETYISQGTSRAAIPMELGNFQNEIKAMFTDLSLQLSQVNNKLDMMVNKISTLEKDVAEIKEGRI